MTAGRAVCLIIATLVVAPACTTGISGGGSPVAQKEIDLGGHGQPSEGARRFAHGPHRAIEGRSRRCRGAAGVGAR